MWVYTLIGTVTGVLGFGLGLYNLWRSHREPVRNLQRDRRKFLKQYCEALYHNTKPGEEALAKSQWPSDTMMDQLAAAKDGFERLSKELVVPTRDQLLVLRDRVIAAEEAIDNHIIPTDDRVLHGYIPEIVKTTLADLNRDLEYTMDGLRRIEQGKSLRYKREFKALRSTTKALPEAGSEMLTEKTV